MPFVIPKENTFIFTRITLNRKVVADKKTPTGLDVKENSTTCPCTKIPENCILSKTKANSCICNHGIISCLAVRSGYDIGNQLSELQKIGFFDPADYTQEALLIKIINNAKVKVK